MRKLLLLATLPWLVAASPPLPRTPGFGFQDYPEAARLAGVEGDVRFDLVIDEKGKVASCTVTAGADLPERLAADTCAAATARWRFAAARDDAGKKTSGRLSYSIAWRIALACPKPDGQTVCVFL
jgi:TonB family protein